MDAEGAFEKYKRVTRLDREEFNKVTEPAFAEYLKVRDLTERMMQSNQEEAQRIREEAWEKYEEIRSPAWEKFQNKKNKEAWEEYSNSIDGNVGQKAQKEYSKRSITLPGDESIEIQTDAPDELIYEVVRGFRQRTLTR